MTVKKVEELSESEKLMLINSRLFINSVSTNKSVTDIDLIQKVSNLNTAIEILMHFVISSKNIPIEPNSAFQKLRNRLQKLIDKGSLSDFALSKLEPIIHARNAGLHRGFAPQSKYIQDWAQITKEFYDYVSKEIFGKTIELSMLSFISQEYWKNKFLKIEEQYTSRIFAEFFNSCTNILRDIESFLIALDIEDVIYNKYVLDIDQLKNYEQSIFRFNALNFGIKFTEFKKLLSFCSFLSDICENYESEDKIIVGDGKSMSVKEFLNEFHSVESIQEGAERIYFQIWDYLVRTGISSINPFDIGRPVEVFIGNKKIETRLIIMLITRPKYNQLYVGFLQDFGSVHNLERKKIKLNWVGFGRTTTPIPITKIDYHYLNSRDFTFFILECDQWDYLNKAIKNKESKE